MRAFASLKRTRVFAPNSPDARSIIRFRPVPTLARAASSHNPRQVNLIMTTKSPIVLIALASSAALAQQAPGPGDGNIPAPGLFDSQIVCSNSLPSMRPTPTRIEEGATASALDTAIGMGNARITDQDLLDDLRYMIPLAGSNCGQGATEDAFMTATQGAVATDVAEGYSALRPAFMAVYGDPDNAADSGTAGALRLARKALQDAEADDTTTAARLTALRNAVTRAQEADTEARAGFNAIVNGPIDDVAVNPIYSGGSGGMDGEVGRHTGHRGLQRRGHEREHRAKCRRCPELRWLHAAGQ